MKSFENFNKSLENLGETCKYEPPYETVILIGLVGLFKIAFDETLKVMRGILIDEGFYERELEAPRQILKTAYEAGLIEDEEGWLLALQSRNNVTHAYNDQVALDIVRKTAEKFYPIFQDFREKALKYK